MAVVVPKKCVNMNFVGQKKVPLFDVGKSFDN
jgi:hypothetical protein